MHDTRSLFGGMFGGMFGYPPFSASYANALQNQQMAMYQRNSCPCCGRPMSQLSDFAGLGDALAVLSQNSRKPQPLPSDKEMKDRFESLSKRIDAAVEKYNGLLS